jgi:hypothetical protein
VPFGLGLGLYVVVIARFDVRQLAVGRGDHWITGGGLGISSLAAARLAIGAAALGVLGGRGSPLEDIAVVLWVLSMLWLVVLLLAEARWPRPAYEARRWSTVFPLGMYAASGFVVGVVAHAGVVRGPGASSASVSSAG